MTARILLESVFVVLTIAALVLLTQMMRFLLSADFVSAALVVAAVFAVLKAATDTARLAGARTGGER